jgi:hypothetical protein
MAPLPGETRGERVKRVKQLFGWTPREANRKVAAWDETSSPEALEKAAKARERHDEALREEAALRAAELAEFEAQYAAYCASRDAGGVA